MTVTDIKTSADLFGPGAQPGTVPTDLEQATGQERLEILGKMEGVDIFDMRPLDASRQGTVKDPILVRSAGDEQYAGCTGYPADSHQVIWLTVRLLPPLQHHHHHHHRHHYMALSRGEERAVNGWGTSRH